MDIIIVFVLRTLIMDLVSDVILTRITVVVDIDLDGTLRMTAKGNHPYRPRSRLTSESLRFESSLSSPSTPGTDNWQTITGGGWNGWIKKFREHLLLEFDAAMFDCSGELSYRLAEEYESGTLLNSSKTERSKLFLNAIGRLFHEMWQAEGKVSSISRTVEPETI